MKEDLINEVKELLDEVHKTHRYSMSKITEMHNRVFNTNHRPQAVASILIRQVQNLDAWYEDRHIPNQHLL